MPYAVGVTACVTDFVVNPLMGSKAYESERERERDMSTQPATVL